jgi:TolB-like protein/Tfp pilus assembly protein PilF
LWVRQTIACSRTIETLRGIEEGQSMNDNVERLRHRDPRRGALLALAGALVVIVVLVVGLNTGGLRDRLFGRIGVPRIESIAVLPIENLSQDPEQAYFADGMTDALNYELSLFAPFRVISSNSVMSYKKFPKPLPEIARELNVAAVVKGSVQRSGDRVRMIASLIDAPGDRKLWEQTYERDLRDTPVMIADISRAITSESKARISPQQEAHLSSVRPVNPQALEASLRAAYGGNPAKAMEYLQQAIQLEPGFASPYAALAGNYYWSNFWPAFPPRDTYPKAKEAAQKALSLDPTFAPAHFYSALVALEYDWNYAEAEKEFKHNLELRNCADTHHHYAHFLLSMGRTEEAVAETKRALEINPNDAGLISCVAWHDITMGNYEEAEKRCSQALSMGAAGPFVPLMLGWSYEQRGRFDEAIAELQKSVVGWGNAVFPTAALGHAYASAGKTREAREVLDRLLARSKKEYVSPYEIAAIYAGLGDRDRAFEWLQKAYEERASFLVHFRMDPRIRSLQSDPRFQDLLRRMNFPL